MEPKADLLVEISWEVCNKVGGIYTVVKSKIGQMQLKYGEHYFLIGPYFPKKAHGIFEESICPEEYKNCFEKLKSEGIEIHWGRWITPGSPTTILIDFSKFTANTNDIKRKLWEWYGIDSLRTQWYDFDEPVVWAWAVGRLIEEMKNTKPEKKIVAHFHEWLTSAGLLYLKRKNVPVSTVFTTHATTLGRALASMERDLYSELDTINPDEEAKKISPGIFAKHSIEKSTALNSDVFTTVSEITGIESEKFLSRKPDVLLFNGLDMSKFPTFEQASVRHKLFKSRIKQFLMYYFFPYYTFDLNNTLIYFIAGRYEFHDKGVDIFIDALKELNQKLKEEKSNKTIVAFFWIPGNTKSIRTQLLEDKTYFKDIADSLEDVHEEMHARILELLVTGKNISEKTLFPESLQFELKPKLRRFKREGLPPISTHELFDEEKDLIMNALKAAGLRNREEDRVKVVFYPIYLSGADGLLDTSYYESMQGSHLGVFPSFYEPWGYTPLEAAALGVSSITTDLAGFGRFICAECTQERYPGVFVLKRYKRPRDKVISDLTKMMKDFAYFTDKERTENKIAAQKVAHRAEWRTFIENYIKAHNIAIERT
ncbi:hypothetical protein D6825_02830 [Candidatus Woesearchaeota archaeon]|nr:MAG: hypothetical protein D6825_02830 [Candidatus Woesearchaeota archaeon]